MKKMSKEQIFSEPVDLERVPPHDDDAEASLLGSMLLSSDVIPDVLEIVSSDSFYREAHRRIFRSIQDLYLKGEAVDYITVAARLKNKGELESIGGREYLLYLASVVPTAANALQYAQIVERHAVLRSLLQAATEIAQIAYQGGEDVNAILDKVESIIFSIAKKKVSEKFMAMSDLVREVYEMIENVYHRDHKVTGLETGFPQLDELTSGFHPSDLIIVAARPGMGKTSFVLNIAQHVAIKLKKPVAIFSLEMSRHQLAQRLLCSEGGVDANKLKTGRMSDIDWRKLLKAAGSLSEAPIFIDDTPSITFLELKAKARRLARQVGNLSLLIVDYLQLMQGNTRAENRQQEISEISRALKILGRELNVPVVAVSQLSRAVEQRRESKKPVLSDLRESGALEQDADLVIFIYREDYYKQEKSASEKDVKRTEIIVAKQRNGPVGTVELGFKPKYVKFVNLEKRHLEDDVYSEGQNGFLDVN